METLNPQEGKDNSTAQIEENVNPIKPVENRRPDGKFGPGNNANPKGRPKGKSLKEYDRERFAKMTEEEKEVFLKQIAPDLRYRMAEGNPATPHEGGETPIKVQIIPGELIDKNEISISPEPIPHCEGQE